MHGRIRRSLVAGAIVAVAVGAAGGIAYATTTGGGVISACAKTANGQLRLDTGDGCLPSEQGVQWNEAGPQGATGPAGTSHVDEWAWYQGVDGRIPIASGLWPAIRGHDTVVLTFHLEKGQYLVSSEILAINGGGEGIVVCRTGNDALGISLAQGAVGNAAGFAQQQTLQEQTVFVVPTAQDLTVRCFNAPQGDAPIGQPAINFIDVTATKIDSSTFDGVPN